MHYYYLASNFDWNYSQSFYLWAALEMHDFLRTCILLKTHATDVLRSPSTGKNGMLLQPSSVSLLPHSVSSGPSWPKSCCSSFKTSIHQWLPSYTSNWRCSCLSLMWPKFKTQRRRKILIIPLPSSFLSFPSLYYLTACKSKVFSQRFRGLFISPSLSFFC